MAPIIDKRFVQTRWNVTYKKGRSVKYAVVHYTGTDASAQNNCKYFGGGNRNASADFFIDKDGSIYQFNKDLANYYTWHCGDGKGKYGISNSNSIGIEVVSSGGEFTEAQKKALHELVMWLMEQFGIKAENVVRHYDASRKSCPAPYCGSVAKDTKWKLLHAYITGGEATSSSEPAKTTTTTSKKENTVTVTLKVLSNGSRGEQVKTLQRLLNALGYSCGSADGIWGKNTDAAVRKFQKAKGLTVDGICGKNTWCKLLGA